MNKKKSKFKVSQTPKGIKDRQSIDYYTGKTITFMSKLEKQYYDNVVIPGLNDGSIIKYELQKKYQLQPSFKYMGKTVLPINYVGDFDIYYSSGKFEVIDTKGYATADAKLKAKMFKKMYPNIYLRWIAYTKSTGWIEYDQLQKIRKHNKKHIKEN